MTTIEYIKCFTFETSPYIRCMTFDTEKSSEDCSVFHSLLWSPTSDDNTDIFLSFYEDGTIQIEWAQNRDLIAHKEKDKACFELYYRDLARIYGTDIHQKEEESTSNFLKRVLHQFYLYYLKMIYVDTLKKARDIELHISEIFDDNEDRMDYNSRSQNSEIYQKLWDRDDPMIWKINEQIIGQNPFAATISIPYDYPI